MAYPSQNLPVVLGTFIDGQIVSANDATFGLNPKIEQIRSAVNDHAGNIDALNAQVSALGGIVYNVVAYGADPTGVADSTTAIQNAINTAITNQGIVVFSNGIYRITDTLNLTGTCYLTSDGAGQGVTLFQTTAGKSFFNISSGFVRITDLKMDYQGSTTPANGMIYRALTAPTYLSGIVIQRCQFYSTASRSFTAISLNFIQASLISDCSVTGSATSTVNFLALTVSQNVVISRNVCTSCASSINLVGATYGSVSRNIVIDQNTIVSSYADAITIAESINIYVEKNSISNFRSSSTAYFAIRINPAFPLNVSYITIKGNVFDNSTSLSTTLHGAISAKTCYYLTVSENLFNNGASPVTIVGSYAGGGTSNVGFNQIISDNFFIRPFATAVSVGDFGGVCTIKGNVFIDVVRQTGDATVIFNNCVATWGGSTVVRNSMIVADNYLDTVGTTGFTSLNRNGVQVVNGSLTQTTQISGNDFSNATFPYVDAGLSTYMTSAIGRRIVRTTSSSAPTTGAWNAGDQVLLTAPTAGGYIGYVCVGGGSPGTWKGFGAIQA